MAMLRCTVTFCTGMLMLLYKPGMISWLQAATAQQQQIRPGLLPLLHHPLAAPDPPPPGCLLPQLAPSEMIGTIFCIVGLSELLGGNIFWGTHDAATGWLSTAINGHQGARSAHYLRNMAIIWPLRAPTKKN